MKTDLYTKSVLTVIAIALCTIAFKNMNFVDEAKAESKKMLSDEINVNIAHVGGSSVYGTLPINLKELDGSSVSTLPVNVKELNGSRLSGTVPINIKEVYGTSVSMNGVPVNIEAVNGSDIYDAIPVKNK